MAQTLGELIRGARGDSLRETARKAKLSPGYLSRLERGMVRRPGPAVLAALADAVPALDYATLMRAAGYR